MARAATPGAVQRRRRGFPAASAFGAVLRCRYADAGAPGPIPNMWEFTGVSPGKLASAWAEAAATLIHSHRPAHGNPDAPREGLARPVTVEAAGDSGASGPDSSQPGPCRGRRLAGAWRMASQALRAGRDRLEPTVAGRVWRQLSELDVFNSSLQFAAVFTLGFIPFLMVLSDALGSGLARAIIIRGGFNAKAAHDVAMLFAHGRAAPAGLPVLGLVLAVVGGAAISQMLQSWYGKIFRTKIGGWKAMARRVEWVAGVSGFVALQVVIGRTIPPLGGPIAAVSAQFFLAVVFWWWSLHCLLSGQIGWRRLFAAGLATAVCYSGLGVYIVYVMSSSVVSNEAMFGPFGAVFTLVTAEIGLAVALQLGAAIGASFGRSKDPAATDRADPGPDVSQLRTGPWPSSPPPAPHTTRGDPT